MKKIICITMFIITMLVGSVHADISESFSKILEMMEIPLTNPNGYYINEDIYNKYNLIVYGKPSDVIKNQRWKDVSNGKWLNETTGKPGEYRILGYSLTGTVVNNELFPDDYNSGKSPEEWNYIVIEDALSSWNDTEKYQTKEQYEYMLNQKLSRNGTTYNITAKDIGLDKVRLEAYATWKTAGSVFTLKYDNNGVLWGATFNIKPMAGDAQLNAILDFEKGTDYTINKNTDILEIPFNYGAEVVGLTEHTKPEHVRNLTTEIEVQFELFDKIKSEKVTSILKDNKIIIDKNKYPGVSNLEIIVKNTSILETCFFTEAPLVDIKEVILNVNLDEDEVFIEVTDVNKRVSIDILPPVISSIKLYRKTINGDDNKKTLYIANKTNTSFICAGQILVVEAKILNNPSSVKFYIEGDSRIQRLDDLTKRFVYDEPQKRGEKLLYPSLIAFKNSYKLPLNMEKDKEFFVLEYIIPYGTKQSLHSWNTLREQNQNALSIDKSKLFNRISEPYKIKIIAKNNGGTVTRSISLDVFERWDTIYNRDLSEYVK